MVGLGENSLVELMNQRKKEYFSVLVNHEWVILARVYKSEQNPAARFFLYQSLSSPPKEDQTTFDMALKSIGNHQRGFSHSNRSSTRHHNVYTKTHSLYPLCLHPSPHHQILCTRIRRRTSYKEQAKATADIQILCQFHDY
jgi:hypothetical protein